MSTAETHLRRLQDAIKAGANPAALVEALNQVYEERTAAQALLESVPVTSSLDRAKIETLVDHLGNLTRALQRASGADLQGLYRDIGLSLTYDPTGNAVDVAINPTLVGILRVSEGRVGHNPADAPAGPECPWTLRHRLHLEGT